MTNKEKQDQFQSWLIHMDQALDEFIARFPSDVQSQLDLGAESLLLLERLVLERYGSPAATRDKTEAAFLDGAARYCGEVVRKASGAKWSLRLDDKNSVFHGFPILFGGEIKKVPESPLTAITASTDRRTGIYLRKIFDHVAATADN